MSVDENPQKRLFRLDEETIDFLTHMGCERIDERSFQFNSLRIRFYEGYREVCVKLTDLLNFGKEDGQRFFHFNDNKKLQYFLGAIIESQQGRDYSFICEIADSLGGEYPSHIRELIESASRLFCIGKGPFLRISYSEFAGMRYVKISNGETENIISLSDKEKLSEMKKKIIEFAKTNDPSIFNEWLITKSAII